MRGISVLIGVAAVCMLGGAALAASPLDGTQWHINLMTSTAKTSSEDRINFEKGRFISPFFEPKGFSKSNYTLTEEKGQPVVWETMQTSPTEGTLSWRGELGGDTMHGVASWQKADGTVVAYRFTGKRVGEAPRAATPKAEEPRAAKPTPEAPSAVKAKSEDPGATGAKPEETKAAKPKSKTKAKSKAPAKSKPE